jgi:hypothetical protein
MPEIIFDGRIFDKDVSYFIGIKKDESPKPYCAVTVFTSRRFKSLKGAIKFYSEQKRISVEAIEAQIRKGLNG